MFPPTTGAMFAALTDPPLEALGKRRFKRQFPGIRLQTHASESGHNGMQGRGIGSGGTDLAERQQRQQDSPTRPFADAISNVCQSCTEGR